MHLEHVQLQGFKSFVQRTEVALCPHFTCVTGPNGSGKSNILDAICFALTEGDLANLRVRSMTELVSTDASVDKASVVLTFVGAGSGSEKTRLQATCRKKDGAREFKLDGVAKAVELTVVASNHHVELNPSDAGTKDSKIVQEVIKEIAQNHSVAGNSSRTFKVVVLNEVDRLSVSAQSALRRTMEKYSAGCRLILSCNSACRVIEPVRSRCMPVRVPAPS
jgi:DNA polymerase III delta prime subunit